MRNLVSSLLRHVRARHAAPGVHVTSLAPRNLDAQIDCLRSWKLASRRICTVNHARELSAIAPSLPGWIEAVPVEFEPRFGKYHLPYREISPALAQMKLTPTELVSFANSDIALRDLRLLAPRKHVRHDLIFASRMNVDEAGNDTGMYRSGFDFFSFKASDASLLEGMHYHVGQPWGDFVLPVMFLRAGKAVGRVDAPAITHRMHDINWSQDVWATFGVECARDLFGVRIPDEHVKKAVPILAAEMKAFLNSDELGYRRNPRQNADAQAEFDRLQVTIERRMAEFLNA